MSDSLWPTREPKRFTMSRIAVGPPVSVPRCRETRPNHRSGCPCGPPEWIKSMPEGLRDGIPAFMDTQGPVMDWAHVPVYWAKQKWPAEDAVPTSGTVSATGSTHHAAGHQWEASG